MRWSIVVPGALVPAPIAADVIAAASLPNLARLLSRAAVDAPVTASASTQGAAHLGWLWQRFARRDDTPVSAPYALQALGAAPGERHIWHADPVHFAFARDHMLVTTLDDLPDDEATALAEEAGALLASAGASLLRIAGRWFVSFDRDWRLQTAPLDVALGESVQPHLPQGEDAAAWRRLLTEVQIAWHHHPVNAAREARGAAPVNGLWLHGGGRHGALPASRLAQVASHEPAIRGWARASGAAAVTDGSEIVAGGGPRGDALALWPDLFAACKADAWGGWLPVAAHFDTWLGAHAHRAFSQGASIELVLAGRTQTRTLRLSSGDRWRPWRRHALAPLFSEEFE